MVVLKGVRGHPSNCGVRQRPAVTLWGFAVHCYTDIQADNNSEYEVYTLCVYVLVH